MTLQSNRLLRIIVSLAMIFCLLLSLCVPTYAVVGVDDAIIAALIAILGSMGMDFLAQGLDRSGVIDEVVKWAEDNIGLLPDDVELALVAPNVLTIGGALWNYAVECADWFKSKFPSGSGTDNLVSPSAFSFQSANVPFDVRVQVPNAASVTPLQAVSTIDCYFVSIYDSSLTRPDALTYRVNGKLYYVNPVLTSSPSFDSFISYVNSDRWAALRYTTLSSGLVCNFMADDISYNFSSLSAAQSFLDSHLSSSDPVGTLISFIEDGALSGSSSSGSLDLVGTDVASPDPVPDNKNMFLGLPSSFGSLPEFVNRVFDGVDSDTEAGPLQSDYSSQLSDLIDVNGNILSNTNSIAQGISGILTGVEALVADLVGFIGELPGYIGSLTGKFLSIWHYVVDWVNSLRPFLNSMLSVWSNLPVAMVLPVYATAVIVIVLGLYKRFFM